MTLGTASGPTGGAGAPAHRGRIPQSFTFPRQVTIRTIARLYAGYRDDAPGAVASVARLRRSAGGDPYTATESWGADHLEALRDAREERRVAEEQEGAANGRARAADSAGMYRSRAWQRSRAQEEREDVAVHLALTLWALHQQSIRDEGMCLPGWPLGRAVRRLAHGRTGTTDLPPSAVAAEAAAPSPARVEEAHEVPAPSEEPVEEARRTIRKRFVRVAASTDVEVLAGRLREVVLLLRAARIPLDYGLLADQLVIWQDENRRDEVTRAWGKEFHRTYRPYVRDADGEEEAAPDPERSSQQMPLEADLDVYGAD
ncbi:type I-E CRISPR-associated protein Cse2/CasB [Streptomyces sp. NPDC097619]|uniref:type I-E CRISPR-associated protein Cse2/CasB n=1 Tax=Streptomyces sp. NPDC097619 TaxID=3157228 RepID=UPI003331C15D